MKMRDRKTQTTMKMQQVLIVEGQHSASKMSFHNRIGSFRTFVVLVKELPSYNPNEAESSAAFPTGVWLA